LNQALEIFELKPDFELKTMTENQSLADLTANLLSKFTNLYSKIKPDLILVHGDTSTAFVGALSAFYLNIPVAHIEAGLRTFDLLNPFPEEFNRQAIARISKYHLVPTKNAFDNLISEGISQENLFLCGNTIVDSVRIIQEKLKLNPNYEQILLNECKNLFDFDPKREKYILVTLHRRESFGDGVDDVCRALKQIATEHPDIFIVFPVHLNPKVRNHVFRILSDQKNIFLVDPIKYDLFILLSIHSKFIITDSGGIQEEAVSLSKRVLVTRNKTERTEGIESGLLKIISTDFDEILNSVNKILDSKEVEIEIDSNPFGIGKISEKIVNHLDLKFN
jgi:UDP-N-acetylglucosamine 2-epimerase (non-hydrolysing)